MVVDVNIGISLCILITSLFISLKGCIGTDVSDIHLSKQVHHMHFIVAFTDTRIYCTGSKVHENWAEF